MSSGPDWRAIRISTAVLPLVRTPGPPGRVLSVHSTAVNLVLDDELVTVAHPSAGGLPNGILLDQAYALAEPGRGAVVRDGESLVFGTSRVRVDLRDAAAWSPKLGGRLGPLPPLNEVRTALARALDQVPAQGGFSPLLRVLSSAPVALTPLCSRALSRLAQLASGAEANDLPSMLEAAVGLVGLGDGLTPSGDDLLVGFSAAMRASAHPLAEHFAAGCARLAPGRTTRVAEMFLEHAARGAYSERIHRLVTALADTEALTTALRWGATSGADTLLGVVLGSYTTSGESIQLTTRRLPGPLSVSFTSVPA
jgi:Protein of unknown function (DUF2877)